MTPSRPFLLSHLVPAAAERDPDGDALVSPEGRLSRAGLARRVAQLGTLLRSEGVAPGDRVAIFAPKALDTFVAVHAALHAGAIAVPIDPQAPESVVEALCQELNPTAVALHPSTSERWPEPSAISIGAGADRPGLAWQDADGVAPLGPVARTSDDAAYVISTSGSTGRPKSIVHTHASALRYAELAADCYSLGRHDRMANVAPFHFDQSTFELYAGPLAGACTVLVPEILLRFPASVSELLERERITTWYSVPTILRQLHARGALEQRELSALRWVLFGGEIYPPSELRELMRLLPGARFSNVYGPAEVNQCTHHHLDGPPVDDTAIPIGRPWPDTEVRVVGPDPLDLAADREPPRRGELLVRTATAMAGYWNQPEATARAFVREPVDGAFARTWYRTGDIVDVDDAGLMRFVGRADRQVKIRGVRVELEAVEAAMNDHAGVIASAAVVVDTDGERRLVGIVETDDPIDLDELARELRGRVSAAALPERFLVVDRLPRGPSGKVDVVRAVELCSSGVDR